MLLFVAISLHKAFSAMSISTRFLMKAASPTQLFVLLLPYHVLPPVAILVAAAAGATAPAASLLLSGLATGTFVYIGAFEVVSEEFADCSEAVKAAAAAAAAVAADGAAVHGEGDDEIPALGVRVERGYWVPSKGVKAAAFVSGAGLLLALLAAVPHEHHHG